MLAQKYFVLLLLLVLLLHDGEAWTRRRRRRRAPPPCNARDCEVGEWSGWTGCSHRCGNADTQYRTRTKTVTEACGGTCYYDFREQRNCDVYPCQNGGTPSYGDVVKRKGKANPSSQESNSKNIEIGCGVGIPLAVCVICTCAYLIYFGNKKGYKPFTLIVNCICCNNDVQDVTVARPVAWHTTELTMADRSIKTTGKVVALPDYSHYNYGCNYGDLPLVDG